MKLLTTALVVLAAVGIGVSLADKPAKPDKPAVPKIERTEQASSSSYKADPPATHTDRPVPVFSPRGPEVKHSPRLERPTELLRPTRPPVYTRPDQKLPDPTFTHEHNSTPGYSPVRPEKPTEALRRNADSRIPTKIDQTSISDRVDNCQKLYAPYPSQKVTVEKPARIYESSRPKKLTEETWRPRSAGPSPSMQTRAKSEHEYGLADRRWSGAELIEKNAGAPRNRIHWNPRWYSLGCVSWYYWDGYWGDYNWRDACYADWSIVYCPRGYFPSCYYYYWDCIPRYFCSRPVIVINVTPRYWRESYRGHLNSHDQRLVDEAIYDIRRAWERGDISRFSDHLRQDDRVDVYLDGIYRYSLPTQDYYEVTLDAMRELETTDFDLQECFALSSREYFFSARHTYYDRSGERRVSYQFYILERSYGEWYIAATGSSARPIVSPPLYR